MPTWSPAKKARKQKEFLTAYRLNPCIANSAKDVGISVDLVLKWRKTDKKFLARFVKADTIGIDDIESRALRRAAHTSDRLAEFFLKKRRSEVYGDKLTIGLDMNQLRELVSQMLGVLQRKLPRACPHCKTELDLAKPIAAALLKESAKFGTNGAAVSAV